MPTYFSTVVNTSKIGLLVQLKYQFKLTRSLVVDPRLREGDGSRSSWHYYRERTPRLRGGWRISILNECFEF